jgi:hypothetical protein
MSIGEWATVPMAWLASDEELEVKNPKRYRGEER